MNAELVDRLEKSLVDSDSLKVLEATVADLWEELMFLKSVVVERTGQI